MSCADVYTLTAASRESLFVMTLKYLCAYSEKVKDSYPKTLAQHSVVQRFRKHTKRFPNLQSSMVMVNVFFIFGIGGRYVYSMCEVP